MKRQFSAPLLHAWTRVTGVNGLPGPDGALAVPSGLSQAVKGLSDLFTRGRTALPSPYLDEAKSRLAYLAYYFPVNVAKVQVLLDEMPAPALVADVPEATARPFTVLDLGCGPGAGTLGTLDWLRQHPTLNQMSLHLVAADRSAHALEDCTRIWSAYTDADQARNVTLVPVRVDLERFHPAEDPKVGGRSYDLIILANTLNELFTRSRDPLKRRVELVRHLLGLLDQHGTLMIIEPALRETSRQLHLVRNQLLEDKLCTVYSPCLHERPCPALLKETDWCYEERSWVPPPLVTAIDREVEFIKDALKFSYLLLRKDGRTIVPRNSDVYRVVSELREMKGEKRAWLCHQTGRPEVGRLDRELSLTNEAFDSWHRGAIVKIDRIVRKERKGRESTVGRIPASANVEILRSV